MTDRLFRLVQTLILAIALVKAAQLVGGGLGDQNAAAIRQNYEIFQKEMKRARGDQNDDLNAAFQKFIHA